MLHVDAPGLSATVPGGSAQAACTPPEQYEPTSQDTHAVRFPFGFEPGPHTAHTLLPVPIAAVPCDDRSGVMYLYVLT